MEIEEQLRSESDSMLDAMDQLRSLEAEKRAIPPNSRRFQMLARDVERLADTVVSHAEQQTDLGEQAAERHQATGEEAAPINAGSRDVATILGEWRDAERRASAAEAGSADEAAARADVDRLRHEYQQAQRSASTREDS